MRQIDVSVIYSVFNNEIIAKLPATLFEAIFEKRLCNCPYKQGTYPTDLVLSHCASGYYAEAGDNTNDFHEISSFHGARPLVSNIANNMMLQRRKTAPLL